LIIFTVKGTLTYSLATEKLLIDSAQVVILHTH